MTKAVGFMIAAGAVALAACSTPNPQSASYPQGGYPQGGYPQSSPSAQYPASSYPAQAARYGYVDSVEVIPATAHQGPGIGAIGGAIAGGVLGNQVGSGTGRAVATIGGAVAGGVIGNEVEKRVSGSSNNSYRFRVRLDDGTYQTITQDVSDDIRAGDRVRIENGRIWRS